MAGGTISQSSSMVAMVSVLHVVPAHYSWVFLAVLKAMGSYPIVFNFVLP